MEIRKGNPYAGITVLILVAILFIGYWVFIPVYGNIHSMFHDDSKLAVYVTEQECLDSGNYWVDSECSKLSERAESVISNQRSTWLAVPFIFVLGLLIWFWTKATKNDYQEFQGP